MNIIDSASLVRQYFLPKLQEGSVRRIFLAGLGFLGSTTPIHGRTFAPETLKVLSNGAPAIEQVLSKIPESNFTQWLG